MPLSTTSTWTVGAALRCLLFVAMAATSLVWYLLILWPLGFGMSEGPWFTYEYLRGNQELWKITYDMFERMPWLSPWTEPPIEIYGGLWLIWIASVFALYLGAFALLRRSALEGSGSERRFLFGGLITTTVALHTILVLAPGIVTTDVFSYVMYGRIAGLYGGNPFVQGPSQFAPGPLIDWIAPMWRSTPSVYGPLWIDLSWVLARVTVGLDLVRQVLVYRLVVNLGHLASVVLFALAARGLQGRMALPSTVLFAWSPLMLFEFAGNGHNDALMLTLVLLAVLAWMRGWMPVAIGLLAASAMVKYVTLLTIPLFLALWVRQQPTWRRRLIVCGLGATIVAAVAAVFYAPWFAGEATFSALRGWTTEPQYANSPTDMVATDLARLLAPGGGRLAEMTATVRSLVRWGSWIVLVTFVAWEAFQTRTLRDACAGSARVLLVFLLVATPWVLPWYFSWPLAFGLLAGWERQTTRVAVVFSLTAPAVVHFITLWGGVSPSPLLNVIYLWPLALPILPRLLRRSVSHEPYALPSDADGADAESRLVEVQAA